MTTIKTNTYHIRDSFFVDIFLDLVETNLDEYIQYYKDEFEDQEDEICQL